MKILLLLVLMMVTGQAYASGADTEEGKELLATHCQSCHRADNDPPKAPPMYGVQKRYKMDSADKADFVRKVSEFVQQPSEEKALLKRAIQHVGLMPAIDVAEVDLKKVAAYIHDASFAVPCSHFKAAMKMAKAKGDTQHYNHAQGRYSALCSE
jgi:mono/diheme cytochrome c family protein